MQRRQHNATSSSTHSSYQDERQYYCLHSHDGYSNSVLYQVVPAGRNFFHILEVTSGRIKGFRSDHIQRLRTGKNPRGRPARPARRDRFVTWMTLPRRRPSTTAILARPLKFAPCGSGFISAVTLKGRLYVTEFDIGEFFIHGEAREVDGEFQAVLS